MDEKGKQGIITYRDCIKDGLLFAFIVNTIIGQIIFSSGPIFTLFLVLTIATGLIVWAPIVLVIRGRSFV